MKTLLLLILALSTLWGSMGEITAVKGEAQLLRKAEILPVNKGQAIEVQDSVETSKNSKVQVILNDETIITIGPESAYSFERFDDTQNPEVHMTLKRGIFKVITGKIGKIAPERFKIKTKSAVIGIRGTQFMASVNSDSEKIGCSQGALVVETKQTTFELPAGRMLVYENSVWTMYELDNSSFSPVTTRTVSKKRAPLTKAEKTLPSFQESYMSQEQITDKEHQAPF